MINVYVGTVDVIVKSLDITDREYKAVVFNIFLCVHFGRIKLGKTPIKNIFYRRLTEI